MTSARATAKHLGIPTVAGNEVLYHTRARRPLQDVLTCIRHGVKLSDAVQATKPNAEHVLHAPSVFEALFDDDPCSVARTCEVAERCRFGLDELRYVYPSEQMPDGTTSAQWLRQLTYEGAVRRYGERVPLRAQLDKELAVIEQLDYPGYFLTMHEMMRVGRSYGRTPLPVRTMIVSPRDVAASASSMSMKPVMARDLRVHRRRSDPGRPEAEVDATALLARIRAAHADLRRRLGTG